MTIDKDIALIEEYNEWVLEKKRSLNDTTPTQFLVERAQAQAMEKLLKIEKLVTACIDFGDELELEDIQGIINE